MGGQWLCLEPGKRINVSTAKRSSMNDLDRGEMCGWGSFDDMLVGIRALITKELGRHRGLLAIQKGVILEIVL